MVIALVSKPGLTSASALSIPKDWDAAWFRGFINNLLKGGDVRNAVGSNGISVTGSIASPYATISIGSVPIIINGISSATAPTVTITTTTNTQSALQLSAASTNTQGSLTFVNTTTGVTAGGVGVGGTVTGSGVNDLQFFGHNGSNIVFAPNGGSSPQITFASSGAVTIAAPASAVTALTVNSQGAATFGLRINSGSASQTVAPFIIVNGTVGVEAIRIDTCATTGTGTATFTATNKPTATAGGPVSWIPISIDAVRRYIPVWA